MSWNIVDYDSKYINTSFDCGISPLNDYLRNQMSQDVKRQANVPSLAISQANEIIGYYTLSAGEIQFDTRYPVPVTRIGRLAVCKTMQ